MFPANIKIGNTKEVHIILKIEKTEETRTLEITVYRASDGTAFDSSYECLRYERDSMRKRALNTVRNIETCRDAEGLYPPGVQCCSPSRCIWYRPSSREELDALNDYYSFDGKIPRIYAGRWICVMTEGDLSGSDLPASWADLDSSLSYICMFLNALDADPTDLSGSGTAEKNHAKIYTDDI